MTQLAVRCSRSLLALLLLSLASGCASVHVGREARLLSSEPPADPASARWSIGRIDGLRVSSEWDSELSGEFFRLLEVTFENRFGSWEELTDIQVSLGSPEMDAKVLLVGGDRLSAWSEGATRLAAIERQNRDWILGGIAAVGAVAAAGSNDPGLKAAAGSVALGALTVGAVQDIRQNKRDTERSQLGRADLPLFPETHLLGAPKLTVAPGLFVRRWILFYSHDLAALNSIGRVILSYSNAQGRRLQVELPVATRHTW
jgi:hypothetical protein